MRWLVIGLIVVLVPLAAWRIGALVRRRRDATELRRIAAAASTMQNEAPPAAGPYGLVRAATLRAVLADRGATGVVDRYETAMPELPAAPADPTIEAEVRSLGDFVATLHRNGAKVAAAEQLLLRAVDLGSTDPAVVAAALATLGDVPQHLATAAETFVRHLHSADFVKTAQEAASEFFGDVMKASPDAAEAIFALLRHQPVHSLEHVVVEVFGSATEGVFKVGKEFVTSADFDIIRDELLDIDSAFSDFDAAAGLADGYFPWITGVVSSIRQARAVSDGRTSVGDATANVVRDVASTTVGVVAGSAIGNILFPGLGGVVGAMAGAWVARRLADSVAEADLDAAEAEHERLLSAYHEKETELVATLSLEVREHAAEHRGAYLGELPDRPALAQHPNVERAAYLLADAVAAYLAVLTALLHRAKQRTGRRPELDVDIERVESTVPGIEAALATSRDLASTGAHLAALIALASANVPVPDRGRLAIGCRRACVKVAAALDEATRAHAGTTAQWSEAAHRSLASRATAVSAALHADFDAYRGEVATAAQQVRAAKAAVQEERNKLGR